MKKALCIGINNYPGSSNDLNGCVNDANDWAARLQSLGFQTQIILDQQATKSRIAAEFEALLTGAQPGDTAVMTYSGHGTSVRDTSGDEPDGYDEALYVYDGVLPDDTLRDILKKTPAGVHVVVISDSCFSGTVTRVAPQSVGARVRYHQTEPLPATAKRVKSFLSEEDMVEILLSGCSDKEYSYDAYINGRYNGAFTRYALDVLQPGQTYAQFHTEVRKKLPSNSYPQTPQLEGKAANKARVMFQGDETTPGPEPEPEPEPQPWWKKYWWIIALLAAAVIALIRWLW